MCTYSCAGHRSLSHCQLTLGRLVLLGSCSSVQDFRHAHHVHCLGQNGSGMQPGMTAVSVSARRHESGMQAGMFPESEGSYLYHHRFIPCAYRNATRYDSSSCSRGRRTSILRCVWSCWALGVLVYGTPQRPETLQYCRYEFSAESVPVRHGSTQHQRRVHLFHVAVG